MAEQWPAITQVYQGTHTTWTRAIPILRALCMHHIALELPNSYNLASQRTLFHVLQKTVLSCLLAWRAIGFYCLTSLLR